MKIKILPAFNGDCILISFSYKGEIKNVLIDGGTPKTYQRILKPEIERILSLQQLIDLLVVTHIDEDHIGGIKKLFEDKEIDKKIISKTWFNSGNKISQKFGTPYEDSRNLNITMSDEISMSVKQGVTLEKELLTTGNWENEIIYCGSEIKKVFDLEVTILSPNESKLKELNEKWQIETGKLDMSSKTNDYSVPIKQLIELPFTEDKSIPNGSSIALLIKQNKQTILLLGDSHPSIVINELRKRGISEKNKIELKAVKISHHGSKGNTSDELLSLIDCKNFIISTNGQKHALPDKLTLARIINKNSGCNLYFNYSNELINKIFLEEDICNYKFSVIYLENEIEPYTINISE